jgi:hypothetical protein
MCRRAAAHGDSASALKVPLISSDDVSPNGAANMNQRIASRVATAVAVTAIIGAAACGDRTAVTPVAPTLKTAGGANGVPASHGDTTFTSPPGDTAINSTPNKPVGSFNLALYVGVAGQGADTLQSIPAVGVAVTAYKISYVPVAGSGSDTLKVVETAVATGTTDTNGKLALSNLTGTSFRIEGVPPAGSGLGTGSLQLGQQYAADITATLYLRRTP